WPAAIVRTEVAPLRAANCRFRLSGADWQTCAITREASFRNCEFICPDSLSAHVHPFAGTDRSVMMDNCVHMGNCLYAFNYSRPPAKGSGTGLPRNTAGVPASEFVRIEIRPSPEDLGPGRRKIPGGGSGRLFVAKSALGFWQHNPELKPLEPREEE